VRSRRARSTLSRTARPRSRSPAGARARAWLTRTRATRPRAALAATTCRRRARRAACRSTATSVRSRIPIACATCPADLHPEQCKDAYAYAYDDNSGGLKHCKSSAKADYTVTCVIRPRCVQLALTCVLPQLLPLRSVYLVVNSSTRERICIMLYVAQCPMLCFIFTNDLRIASLDWMVSIISK
jgi:hypothetical protein